MVVWGRDYVLDERERTPEQRDHHLKKRREADKRRREAETPEKFRARLDRQKAYHEKGKVSETEDQRGERLAQKRRSCQQQRLSSETEEQRAARLVQLRNCQQQRLSSETKLTEEREDRLQRDADLHRRIRSVDAVVPLLDQPSVLKTIQFSHAAGPAIAKTTPCPVPDAQPFAILKNHNFLY